MINVNELRIGNWVNFMEDDTRFKVTEINPTGISVENSDESTWIELDQFSGIKLTPEILIATGFHKHNNAWVQDDYSETNYNHWYFTIWDQFDGAELKYNSAEFQVELKSVHQLQNLYFVLTGTELEIKL